MDTNKKMFKSPEDRVILRGNESYDARDDEVDIELNNIGPLINDRNGIKSQNRHNITRRSPSPPASRLGSYEEVLAGRRRRSDEDMSSQVLEYRAGGLSFYVYV
jgi:hypothetical protein